MPPRRLVAGLLFALGPACSAATSADLGAGGSSGPNDAAPQTSATDGDATSDGGPSSDAGAPDRSADGGSVGALPFTCDNARPAPNPCPVPSGMSGRASFCLRPQWSGVTAVDVYGGFGQPSDWTAPFVTLTNDGTGTFVGTTALADGTYPYLFRVHGSVDRLVKDGQYLLDQNNPQFMPHPAGAPLQRSVSVLKVPQAAAPSLHVRGAVRFGGAPQGCYAVDLEAGELRSGSAVVSEHYTANFAESASDGAFDFPVAPGPFGVIVRFPFMLAGADAGYPDPATTPSLGIARTSLVVTAADVTLDPADVRYPAEDYGALSPTNGTAKLPVTFTFTVIPGSSSASVAVIGTSIAGNDPLYWGPFGSGPSASWDGTFGNGAKAVLGAKYYWGTWQKSAPASDGGTVWTGESLLFPIMFQ